MELNAIQDSFERVAKKQKLSYSKSQELIHQVGHEIEQALASIQSHSDSAISVDPKTVLTELKVKLQIVGSHNHLEGPQRDLNMSLSKHQKLLEKMLYPDISNTHFLEAAFQEIHQILKALKSRNLEPAVNWVSTNQERLKESGSNLELKLHKLHFVDILQNRSRADALQYARTYLAPLASYHMKEIQKLMGSLLWAGKLDKSPYANLVDPIHWEKLAEELMQTYCNFAGQSFGDPLSVALAAGAEGLPTLLKLANVMAAKKQEWQVMKQLPVPVELGKEFQFHSVFVCPVSREQGSEENPPMLLPCGHVLCKQSINKLSKGNSRNFKCPYCPQDASVAQCQQLYF
ncbi:UNVERIFIED_CONTAM: protein RMD5 [Sesamum radiatum]|uniref:Protein RMD5 n=1 Tax=Sesamum radiatum TaxID=300843 RepID=A0AAW2MWZ1_SESRA